MMPILPFIEDTVENITNLVQMAHEAGASYILPAFGMSLRAGSRDYYYDKLDLHFPGIKKKYVNRFGGRYECSAPNWRELDEVFQKLVYRYKIAPSMPIFTPHKVVKSTKKKVDKEQMRLL
jgi:DNA repair photolyase